MAHISPWERVIERGRLWADRMHRATVFGLIGSSGKMVTFSAVINDLLSVFCDLSNQLANRDFTFSDCQRRGGVCT